MENSKDILAYLNFETPTIEQTIALKAMAGFVEETNTDDFFILCGAAGTGKSSITSALIAFLNKKNFEYQIAAPTARAARILGRKAQCLSNTIHSLIYNCEPNKETGVVKCIPKVNNVIERTIYIIDEASMISTIISTDDNNLFISKKALNEDLANYIKSGNKSNKVILLGDRNQLAPVNETESKMLRPEFLKETFGWNGTAYFLTEVKRQDKESDIMSNAIKTRLAIENEVQSASMSFFKFSNIDAVIGKYAYEFLNNGSEHCISIGPSHKSNVFFNEMVRRRIFNAAPNKIVKGDWMLITQKWSRNGVQLYSGDHVTVLNIDYSKPEKVAEFTFVPIKIQAKAIDGSELIIDDYLMIDSLLFPSGNMGMDKEKSLRAARFKESRHYRESDNPMDDKYVGALRMTFGYSITCNKAQGGEWSKVFLSTIKIPSLKYQYTAITRAMENVFLY